MAKAQPTEKVLTLAPAWVMIVISVVTIVASAGVSYGVLGYRLGDVEHRVDKIELDRIEKLKDYNEFKAQMGKDVAEINTNIGWIRQALEKQK